NKVEYDTDKRDLRMQADTGDHKADMTDDQVTKNFPKVILDHRTQCAGQNCENSYPVDQLSQKFDRDKNQGKHPNNGIHTHFGQKSGKNGRDRRRRGMVRCGEPEVEWKDGGFYPKPDKKQYPGDIDHVSVFNFI